MAEEQDDLALKEINRQIAEDERNALVRKYAPAFAGVGALLVAGVGGWQVWQSQNQKRAEAAAVEYRAVLKTAADSPSDGPAALSAFAAKAPRGYADLAKMKRAGEIAGTDRAAALALYREVAGEAKAARRIRDLARIRAAYLAFPDGRDAVLKDLGPLVEDASALGAYARELAAIAAFDAGDYEGAQQSFAKLAADADAPAPVKLRAEGLAPLAAAAKGGADVTGLLKATDLGKALGVDLDKDLSTNAITAPPSGQAPAPAAATPSTAPASPAPTKSERP
ncbi:MAG: tetratricopeptide repeat protein [Parvularculaceae bacterium]|nr:tetratricopeptide repeat protein [Parvularculaceae bacterium]